MRGGSGLAAVAPDTGKLGVLLPGVVLAFWTFTGFENLTFLSREFRNPQRDFLPVAAAALGVYALLTALLTVAVALRVPHRKVDQVVGLLQLARTMQPRHAMVAAVTVIAFATMVINAAAWVWGMSRVVSAAAGRRSSRAHSRARVTPGCRDAPCCFSAASSPRRSRS